MHENWAQHLKSFPVEVIFPEWSILGQYLQKLVVQLVISRPEVPAMDLPVRDFPSHIQPADTSGYDQLRPALLPKSLKQPDAKYP